jgi:hypothetical protein
VVLLAGLVGGAAFYVSTAGDRALRTAVAEIDRTDPGWRLPQLEEKRVRPADRDNSALQVLAARRHVPAGWGSSGQSTDLLPDLPPQERLNEHQVRALRTELEKVARARDEARKLADMPEGYYAITWHPDFLTTSPPGIDEAPEVARLLAADALLRAQDNDADGAVRSLQAAVNAGRSLGDLPMAVAQLVRVNTVASAVSRLERVLAQGEPSPGGLKELHGLLEEEDRHPTVLVLARGERAADDAFMGFLESGHLSTPNIRALGAGDLSDPLWVLYLPGGLKKEHAALLRHMTRLVEAARLPESERQKRLEELDAAPRESVLVAHMAPGMTKLGRRCSSLHAQLRCAILMLAAERSRRDHGRWPGAAAALVDAGYLREVPTDPYDGRALRLRRLPDGLVIYAVGPDGQDDGGNLDRTMKLGPGTDLGFRVWDLEKRRQPPPVGGVGS